MLSLFAATVIDIEQPQLNFNVRAQMSNPGKRNPLETNSSIKLSIRGNSSGGARLPDVTPMRKP